MEEVIYQDKRILGSLWFGDYGIVKTQNVVTGRQEMYIGFANCQTEWKT